MIYLGEPYRAVFTLIMLKYPADEILSYSFSYLHFKVLPKCRLKPIATTIHPLSNLITTSSNFLICTRFSLILSLIVLQLTPISFRKSLSGFMIAQAHTASCPSQLLVFSRRIFEKSHLFASLTSLRFICPLLSFNLITKLG